MATFDFYQDRKVTCWERTQFTVEAESYKEALEIVKSWNGKDVLCFEDDEKVIITDGETLCDTAEGISPKENDWKPTIEVFDNKGDMIMNNITQISFDLKTAKKISNGEINGKIRTKGGSNAKIICWDCKGDWPICALIEIIGKNEEIPMQYYIDGIYSHAISESDYDLILEVSSDENDC